MPLVELQNPDIAAQLSPWFRPPDLPEQPLGEHDMLPPAGPPHHSYIDRQVEALREWRERGEYLDHLVSLIHRGHSVSFGEFSTPERLAEETVPIFQDVAGDTLQKVFPQGIETTEHFEPHRGQLLIEDTPPPPGTTEPRIGNTPTKKFKAVIPPADQSPGRHALRLPATPPAEQPIPLGQPERPMDEPRNQRPNAEQAVSARRKLTTRHLGAATMRLVRRLGWVMPRKLQRPRLT